MFDLDQMARCVVPENLPKGARNASRSGDSGMLSVVLVEDSEIIRERLAEMLEGEPDVCIIGQYEDAASAIDGIRDGQPHVVLLDIRLSSGDGMQVMKFVAEERPHTKVIVLTNYSEPQYRTRFLAAGAHEVLDKSNEFLRVPVLLREIAERL
jgi:DNA-binding NarL/FixJ family response regulator